MIPIALRGARVLALLSGLLLSLPMAATGQVLEIDGTGEVKTFAGPTSFHADGTTTALRADPSAPRRRASRMAAEALPMSAHLAAFSGSPAAATPLLADAAGATGLSPDLVEAVAWQESRLRADAVSPAGAIGEMQLMPQTARALGVDPHDSRQNYLGGATYLRAMIDRYHGDLSLALAAYNAGPGAVDRYGGVPPYRETQAYVRSVMDRLSWRALLSPTSATVEAR